MIPVEYLAQPSIIEEDTSKSGTDKLTACELAISELISDNLELLAKASPELAPDNLELPAEASPELAPCE